MDTITLDANNIGSFTGAIASKYAYTPELRKRLDEVLQAATRSTNRYFVLDGATVRAAQSTKAGALEYMAEDSVLVNVEIGCGKMTHVEGTNGGRMPCGAKLDGVPYLCDACDGTPDWLTR